VPASCRYRFRPVLQFSVIPVSCLPFFRGGIQARQRIANGHRRPYRSSRVIYNWCPMLRFLDLKKDRPVLLVALGTACIIAGMFIASSARQGGILVACGIIGIAIIVAGVVSEGRAKRPIALQYHYTFSKSDDAMTKSLSTSLQTGPSTTPRTSPPPPPGGMRIEDGWKWETPEYQSGMKKCPSCGTLNPKAAWRCSNKRCQREFFA